MQRIKKDCKGVHFDRRTFLKGAALGLAGAALPLNKADASFWESFFQKHFQEMNETEIKQVLERLEKEYEQKYKKGIKVGNETALPGVLFGYGLDLSRCIGCRRCVYACVDENNQSRDPQIHWIRVLEFEREAAIRGIDLEDGDPYYDHERVPAEGKFYLPVACMHGGLPHRRHMAGARWDRRDRLRLVHRLPLLHGFVPLRRPAFQLEGAPGSG